MNNVRILKGTHYSLKIPKLYKGQRHTIYFTFGYSVIFTDSCRYSIEEKSCVNKLFGFTDCWMHIHKDSIRFGWSYNENTDRIDIWSYLYKDGKLIKHKVFSVDINEENTFEISYNKLNKEVELWINGLKKVTINTNIPQSKIFCELTPYFGGNTKAPHTMKIKLKQI